MEHGQRYGGYHDGDLHPVDAELAEVILMMNEESTDPVVRAAGAQWQTSLSAGTQIYTRYDNPLLPLDHNMLVSLADLREHCGNRDVGGRLTGYTGPLFTLVR